MASNSRPEFNPSNPPKSRAEGHKSRHVAQLSNIPLLGRTTLMSRFQQAVTETPADSNFPKLLAFLQFWKWIGPYLRDLIHRNAKYQGYPSGKTGIFRVAAPAEGGALTMAVVADWGTGTLEAEKVAENMEACSPHYTLHLGDVYYMGEAAEISENCLGRSNGKYDGVCWPKGSHGSFALMGNHEMYSGGQGYFNTFLDTLGVLHPDKTVKDPQSASYFCLETEHWLVLGLDTGYHSGGVPLFTSIPLINRIPWLDVDARFDDGMMVWLKETVAKLETMGSGKKPVIVLTHHQPISSFEHAFIRPVEQLAELGLFNSREFVWLYGHEHRLTVYNVQSMKGGLKFYPRCIGHGGMPVEVTKLEEPDPRIQYYDPRKHPIDDDDPGTLVGYNGHLVLRFEGSELSIEYRDIVDNNLMLRETFASDGSGRLRHTSSEPTGSGFVAG